MSQVSYGSSLLSQVSRFNLEVYNMIRFQGYNYKFNYMLSGDSISNIKEQIYFLKTLDTPTRNITQGLCTGRILY